MDNRRNHPRDYANDPPVDYGDADTLQEEQSKPWRIHFFQRDKADDAEPAVPAIEFLDSAPAKVAAETHAVLDAVGRRHRLPSRAAASGRRCTMTWPATSRPGCRVAA